MTGLLDRIVATKREEIAALRGRRLPTPGKVIPAELKRRPGDPLRLIAEIKRRSPSAGALSTALSVAERAAAYQEAGATMVSVLCDAAFFDGSFEHLAEARAACGLPLLCKDFVLDEVQLDFARAFGASAVLLIVRCLTDPELQRLIAGARERGLLPVVEITSAAEAERALALEADCVGVNARDLDTLAMDRERAGAVLGALPSSLTRAWFSGLKDPAALSDPIYQAADAALIGEGLMREDDPGPLLRRFVQTAQTSVASVG